MSIVQPVFSSPLPFPGQVALVTGAAQGIGAAVAEALVQQGVSVVALDVRHDALMYTVQQCGAKAANGVRVHGCVVDVADAQAVENAVQQAEDTLGPICMLASVAGILHTGSVLEQSDDDWMRSFAVNTHGVYHVVCGVARRMQRRSCGSIVAVGSNAALTPRMQMAAYAASKAAMHQFIQCVGLELAGCGIRCNVVAPGSTDTPMQRGMWSDASGAQQVIDGTLANYRNGIPLRRIATPLDVANAVIFLLSDVARHITMHTLCVDGGTTLGA